MRVFVLKKWYVLFFILVFASVIIGTICGINIAISVNATPVTNKVIILDAGHGVPDYGTSSKSGTTEQEINLGVTLKLQKILEQSGARVVLTRSDENGIYELDKQSIRSKKISDMKNRVQIGNSSTADIFISIHMNYYEQEKYSGWQTFYQLTNAKSKRLAELIQSSLNDNIVKNNRNPMAIKGNYIMDNVKIPSVIAECGFLSNNTEEKKLKTDEYQNTLAWGIYVALQKYFMEENSGR